MGTTPGKHAYPKEESKRNNNTTFIVDPDFEEDSRTTDRTRTISGGWETPNIELLKDQLDKTALLDQKKERTLPAIIRWYEPCKSVSVICSNDNWQVKHKMELDKVDRKSHTKNENVYLTILNLAEGEYHYRYIVDGHERHNPREKFVTDEKTGKTSNVIRVRNADFEAFDALLMDSESQKADSDSEYGQVEPRMMNPMEAMKPRNQPPSLPSHLLHKILLNQDTSIACDPSLLPEPNSSQLNHLYALSIREDTLALSATHRFRGRFVTTLLYKPIESRSSRQSTQPRARPDRMT
jgi:5'-AMP-activated protein kinase regulatory beta subunit